MILRSNIVEEFKSGRFRTQLAKGGDRDMEKLIAYCGLDCGQCPAYIATQKNDQEDLAKTAAEWSKKFGMEIKPEDIVCDGCVTPSPKKTSYCNICEIRNCCIERDMENCALCKEYICEKLEKFFKEAPQAKENLEKIKNEKTSQD